MKKTTLTTVLIITMVFIVSTVSYAQGQPSSWYGAMASAYLAEQEIKAQELHVQVKEDKRVEIAANVVVVDDENKPVKLETELKDAHAILQELEATMLPVVDEDNKLLGVLTILDVMDGLMEHPPGMFDWFTGLFKR